MTLSDSSWNILIIQYFKSHPIFHSTIIQTIIIQSIIVQSMFMCSIIILVPLNHSNSIKSCNIVSFHYSLTHSILYHSNIRKVIQIYIIQIYIIQIYIIQNSLRSYVLYHPTYRISTIHFHSQNTYHSLLCHILCVTYYHSIMLHSNMLPQKYLNPSFSFNILL